MLHKVSGESTPEHEPPWVKGLVLGRSTATIEHVVGTGKIAIFELPQKDVWHDLEKTNHHDELKPKKTSAAIPVVETNFFSEKENSNNIKTTKGASTRCTSSSSNKRQTEDHEESTAEKIQTSIWTLPTKEQQNGNTSSAPPEPRFQRRFLMTCLGHVHILHSCLGQRALVMKPTLVL